MKFFFETGSLKGIQSKHKNRLELILDLLDNIESVKKSGLNGKLVMIEHSEKKQNIIDFFE